MGKTIKDVARVAGVSPATVSRVLNNSSKVSELTELKVRKAINELNYQINEPARTLRTETSNLIGVIGAELNNNFLMGLLKEAEKFARKKGFNFLLGDSGKSVNKKIDYLQIMKQKNIDGIIIISSCWKNNFLQKIEENEIPAVIVSGHVNSDNITSVGINNKKAAYQVIKKLYELGHRNIGIITGPKNDKISSQKRLNGVKAACEKTGINLSPNLIVSGDYTLASGFSGAQKLIQTEEKLTAIFAFDDRMGVGAIRGVESLDKKVPEDISVIGFDNIEISKYIKPALSTVHQPRAKLGKTAIKSLISLIEGKELSFSSKFIEYDILLRESTVCITK